MSQIELLSFNHSWPLWEQQRHFDIGHILNCVVADSIPPQAVGALGPQHAGIFECDLESETLVWSGGVYDIFGLPRGLSLSRREVLSLYSEDSRAKLECIRAHAIKHKCGFTLDIDIHAAVGELRKVRLIAAPVCRGDKVVSLHGLKLVV